MALSLFPDPIDPSLDRQLVEARQRQPEEQSNTAIECHKRVAKRPLQHRLILAGISGIGNSPMRRHWLAGPDWTSLLGCRIAECEHEVHSWCSVSRKFAPALAAKSFRRNPRGLQLAYRERMDDAMRMASRAVRGKPRLSFVVQDSFGENRSRTIPCAQEKHIVVSGHCQQSLNISPYLRNRPIRSTAVRNRFLRSPAFSLE